MEAKTFLVPSSFKELGFKINEFVAAFTPSFESVDPYCEREEFTFNTGLACKIEVNTGMYKLSESVGLFYGH